MGPRGSAIVVAEVEAGSEIDLVPGLPAVAGDVEGRAAHESIAPRPIARLPDRRAPQSASACLLPTTASSNSGLRICPVTDLCSSTDPRRAYDRSVARPCRRV